MLRSRRQRSFDRAMDAFRTGGPRVGEQISRLRQTWLAAMSLCIRACSGPRWTSACSVETNILLTDAQLSSRKEDIQARKLCRSMNTIP